MEMAEDSQEATIIDQISMDLFISRYPQRPSGYRRRLRQAQLRNSVIPWLRTHPEVTVVVLDLEEAEILRQAGVVVHRTIADFDLSPLIQLADKRAWHDVQHWYERVQEPGRKLAMAMESGMYLSLKTIYEEEVAILEIADSMQASELWLEGGAPVSSNLRQNSKLVYRWSGVWSAGLQLLGLIGTLRSVWMCLIPTRLPRVARGSWIAIADAPNHCHALGTLQKATNRPSHLIAIGRGTVEACSKLGLHYSPISAWMNWTDAWKVLSSHTRARSLANSAREYFGTSSHFEVLTTIYFYTPQLMLADCLAYKLADNSPAAVMSATGIWPLYRLIFARMREHEIKTFIVAHGNLAAEPAFYSKLAADYMLVESQAMVDTLTNLGVDSAKIIVTGKPTGIISYSPWQEGGVKNILVAMQGFGGEVSYWEYARFIEELKKTVLALPDTHWIIRLHHQQPIHWPVWYKVFGNLPNVSIIGSQKFGQNFDEPILAVVSIFSTQGVEAAMLGINVITLNMSGSQEKVPMSTSKLAVEATNAQELIRAIEHPVSPTPESLDYFGNQMSHGSTQRIAEFIENATQNEST